MLIFDDTPNVATLGRCYLVERQAEVAHIFHNEADAMWQFFCNQAHETDDARVLALFEAMGIYRVGAD